MTIQWLGSPNFDTNRLPIKRIIIHWFGDGASSEPVINAVNNQFQKPGGTSAHYAVENDIVHQYVKEEHTAFHAGNWDINLESIGIEHSGGPNRDISDKTYETSAKLIREICDRYSIPIDREHIEPHNKYRATQCPGTMDIDKLIELAKGQKEEDPRIRRDNLWNTLVKVGTFYDVEVEEDLDKTELKFLADSERRKSDYDNKVEELEELEKKLQELEGATYEVPIDSTIATPNNSSTHTVEVPMENTTQDSSLNQPKFDLISWLISLWHRFKNR